MNINKKIKCRPSKNGTIHSVYQDDNNRTLCSMSPIWEDDSTIYDSGRVPITCKKCIAKMVKLKIKRETSDGVFILRNFAYDKIVIVENRYDILAEMRNISGRHLSESYTDDTLIKELEEGEEWYLFHATPIEFSPVIKTVRRVVGIELE